MSVVPIIKSYYTLNLVTIRGGKAKNIITEKLKYLCPVLIMCTVRKCITTYELFEINAQITNLKSSVAKLIYIPSNCRGHLNTNNFSFKKEINILNISLPRPLDDYSLMITLSDGGH